MSQVAHSGLLQSLLKTEKLPSKQSAGAPGDGYSWHRQNAETNFGQNGLVRRAEWIKEVRNIYNNGAVPWREALRKASENRRQQKADYTTVKTRIIQSYKGRNKADVKCNGPVCPGRYTKPASAELRPNAHRNKRVLTQAAAVKLLKKYYEERSNMKSMKKDISTKRKHAVNPCPEKTITDSLGRTRRLVQKNPECADNWLYRTSKNYDMRGVDHGNKKDSVVYKVNLTK
jgi:hypothetical protein